jgi:hypothetical protein
MCSRWRWVAFSGQMVRSGLADSVVSHPIMATVDG